jgi:predicted signal transduction protein with EAL and GGDEF domain
VERAGFTHEENLPLGRLTVSIGIATFPENGRDVESLTGSADVGLHRAKLAGRNRVMHFDPAAVTDSRGITLRRVHGETKVGGEFPS